MITRESTVDTVTVTPERIEIIKGWVATGAALLDQKRPGWRRKVDILRFEINNPFLCILGQLYGRYINGVYALSLCIGDATRDHGFVGDDDILDLYPDNLIAGFDAETHVLEDAWLHEIQRGKTV